jgi:hypothetical protein
MVDSGQRTELSRRFIAGERLALRIPVPVEPKGREAVWSHVDLFLEYDRNGTSSDDLYAREGLTLVDHRGHAKQAGLRAILLAQDPAVAGLLRSSENVAHTRWRQKGAARLAQDYLRGPSKVGYVLGVVASAVQALLSPEDVADWWTLADLFPEPTPSPLPDRPVTPSDDNASLGEPHDETPTEDDEIEVPPIAPGPARQWRVKPTRDGLRVEANPDYEGPLRAMQLIAAYGLLNRKGFKAHDAADFSFQTDEGMISAKGAEVRATSHNSLRIEPTDDDFCVEITRFDRHRALDYRVAVEDE